MKVGYWIQDADYSAHDFDPVGVDEALAAWRAHDWGAAFDEYQRLEGAKEDCCPPGSGFTRPASPSIEFLQICPAEHGWTIFYRHPARGTDASLMAEGTREGTVEYALHAFFADDQAGVEATLERFVK